VAFRFETKHNTVNRQGFDFIQMAMGHIGNLILISANNRKKIEFFNSEVRPGTGKLFYKRRAGKLFSKKSFDFRKKALP